MSHQQFDPGRDGSIQVNASLRTLWVPGKFPSLNEIIDAKRTVFTGTGKRRPDGYSKLKKAWTQTIRIHALQQRFQRVTTAAHFTYLCVEEDKRRDPSNVLAGAIKLLEDALQEAGLIDGDGWAHVRSIRSHWVVGEPVGVMLGVDTEFEIAPSILLSRHGRLEKANPSRRTLSQGRLRLR